MGNLMTSKAQYIIHLVECDCDCEEGDKCPKCGKTFEDNTPRVMQGAQMDILPADDDDEDTARRFSSDQIPLRNVKSNRLGW